MLFVKLVVMLWVIWLARQKAIHEVIFQTPQAPHSLTTWFIDELEALKEMKPIVVGGGTSNPAGV